MTKRFSYLSTLARLIMGSALLLSLVFAFSCDDDDPEPTGFELPGIYTFKEAILQTTISIGGISVPAGTDITDQMAGGLLAEAECADPANGAVELKSNKQLYFTCLTESKESQAGTWAINSDTTELTLNLATAAGDLSLLIKDVVINESTDVIGGTIFSFPLTKELIAGFLPPTLTQEQKDAILATVPAVTLVDVDIEFQKEE